MGTLSRRDLLKLGLIAGGTSLFPMGRLAAAPFLDGGGDDDVPTSPRTTPFIQDLLLPSPPPQVAPFQSTCSFVELSTQCEALDPECPTNGPVQYYDIEMRENQVELIPGLMTTIWGYDGFYPGPTFMANKGTRFVVRQRNSLDQLTVIHLHGAHTQPDSDGFPTDFIQPGAFRDYCYINCHQAATHWYHDHAEDITGPNVYMGLAGFYIVHDQHELSLNLPSGDFDVPLVFQDRRFNADGSLFYDPFDHDGFLGDKFLVNGRIQPRFEVSKRKYRFRFLNGSNARYYEFKLSNNQPLIQIATEGGLLPRPISRQRIRMAMAERLEVVIDFTNVPLNTSVTLQNVLVQTSGRGPDGVDLRNPTPLLRFDVTSNAVDTSDVPDVLAPDPHITPFPPSRTRRFEFARSHGAWVINGRFFDAERVDADPRLCTSEIWELKNGGGGWEHPIHIHHEDFLILDRNGRTPQPFERGFKDTVNLGPGDRVRVHLPFKTFLGKYVFHCHNVEHEDMRMMGTFNVRS